MNKYYLLTAVVQGIGNFFLAIALYVGCKSIVYCNSSMDGCLNVKDLIYPLD